MQNLSTFITLIVTIELFSSLIHEEANDKFRPRFNLFSNSESRFIYRISINAKVLLRFDEHRKASDARYEDSVEPDVVDQPQIVVRVGVERVGVVSDSPLGREDNHHAIDQTENASHEDYRVPDLSPRPLERTAVLAAEADEEWTQHVIGGLGRLDERTAHQRLEPMD